MEGTIKQIKEKFGAKVASEEARVRGSKRKKLGGFAETSELARAAQQKSVESRKTNANQT